MTKSMSGKSDRRVDIYDHGERIGDAAVNEDGSWEYKCSSPGPHKIAPGYLGTISDPERVFTILPDTSYNFEDLDENSMSVLGDGWTELSPFYCRNSSGYVSSDRVCLYGRSVTPYGLALKFNGTAAVELTVMFKKPVGHLKMKLQHRTPPKEEPASLLVTYHDQIDAIVGKEDIIYPVAGVPDYLSIVFEGGDDLKCAVMKVRLNPGGGSGFELCLNSFEFIE